jgi:hypothetical protein
LFAICGKCGREGHTPVADGVHGAIVKAVKDGEPDKQGVAVVQAVVRAGCC